MRSNRLPHSLDSARASLRNGISYVNDESSRSRVLFERQYLLISLSSSVAPPVDAPNSTVFLLTNENSTDACRYAFAEFDHIVCRNVAPAVAPVPC